MRYCRHIARVIGHSGYQRCREQAFVLYFDNEVTLTAALFKLVAVKHCDATLAVQAEQQPAAQLLLYRMMPVAHRSLRHLDDQSLGIAQQRAHQGERFAQFLPSTD